MIAIILFFLPAFAFAGTLHPERAYQEAWCAKVGGVTEHVLSGGSRVDCLTDEHAIEFDFASKWQEAIGQSLYYARKTGRAPGIVLIMEAPDDQRYLGRLFYTIRERGEYIKVWVVRPEDIATQ